MKIFIFLAVGGWQDVVGGWGITQRPLNVCPDPLTDETILRGPPVASGSPAENILDGRNVNSAGENKAPCITETPAFFEKKNANLNRRKAQVLK